MKRLEATEATSSPGRGRPAAPLLVLVAAVLLGGCYRYAAADRSSLVAGQQVALTLADGSGKAESAARPGKRIEGRVVSVRHDTIAVRTTRPARDRLRTGATVVDTVHVPARRVRSVRRKELRKGRTIAVVGGVALGLGITSAILLDGAGGGGAPPGDGGDGTDRALSIP